MKKWTRWALALGLCLSLLVCGALAADAADISVQLDGQNLTFTDAVPQVKDQRTFLPFRAVFEAMGAQVDNQGSVITAVRGDKTLTMTLDQTTATVTQKGVATTITMDVAPYVDPTTWRTYVPVRFAAQAFGCMVGWDQAASTAIIIDTDKLVDTVMAGKSFTYLEKLDAMSEKYNTGIWNMDATFDADVTMLTMPILTMDGTMTGTTQDTDKMDATMNMKMDMSGMMALTGQSVSMEDRILMDTLKAQGMDLAMRGDLSSGKFYMNIDAKALAAEAGVDPNAWYEVDMAQLMAQAGMQWSDLLELSKNTDARDMVVNLLSASTELDNAANDYADVKAEVEEFLSAFSDQSFALKDGKQTATYTMAQEDATVTMTLALTVDGETVKGYTVGMGMTIQDEDQSVGMDMVITMDDQDKMNAEMKMDMGGLATMGMTMDCAYTPGATAPVTTPPAGATVIPFTQLMGAAQ